MKEKIWMLIELANQYEKEKEKSEWVDVEVYVEFEWEWTWEGYLNKWLTRFDRTDQWEWDNLYKDVAVAYLISKSYGFIWWLVENDKIKDLEEVDYIYWPELVNHQTEIIYTPYSLYESLLMLLSISDTPIDDLISYLK